MDQTDPDAPELEDLFQKFTILGMEIRNHRSSISAIANDSPGQWNKAGPKPKAALSRLSVFDAERGANLENGRRSEAGPASGDVINKALNDVSTELDNQMTGELPRT